jgi:hypothetical protein
MWLRNILWGKSSSRMRITIPWWWVYQNLLLIVLIGLPGWWTGDFYTPPMLVWLAFIHLIAFIHSVVWYDFASLLD